jgi:hypothetical protein
MSLTQIEKGYDVQNVLIEASPDTVFDFIVDPRNLPKWAKGFRSATETTAVLATPDPTGEVVEIEVGARVDADRERGTVDWHLTMPDGSVGSSYSRITPNGDDAVYTFVLMAPPVRLEQVEGALSAQIKQLAKELVALQEVLKR